MISGLSLLRKEFLKRVFKREREKDRVGWIVLFPR